MSKIDNGRIKIKCPKCGSKNILAKQHAISFCRHCGWEGKTKDTI